MSDPFRVPVDPRPLDTMSDAQISLVLGLETVLAARGLVLTCPRCAQEGLPVLDTANSPEDPVWKIDCRCRRRRVSRTDQHMPPSDELLLIADELLAPLSLAVRCRSTLCLQTPLAIRQTPQGVQVTCPCGGPSRPTRLRRPSPFH